MMSPEPAEPAEPADPEQTISVGIVSLGACAFTNPETGFPAGGAELQLYLLARALAQREDCRVTLYVADCGQLSRHEGHLRIQVLVRLKESRAFPATAIPGVVWRLARGRHDLYITRSASAINGLTWLAARLAWARTVHMCAHDDECNGKADATLSRPARWLHHLGLRRADRLLCQGERQRQMLQAAFGREAVPAPSLLPEMSPTPEAGPRAGFLWVGRDVDWKRPELFIELARRLPEEPFTMVCQPQPGCDVGRLRAAAPANLQLLPGLPPAETAALFAHHKALVITSRAEGFPNVLLQAVAAGTPVLSMAVDPDNMVREFQAGAVCSDQFDLIVGRARELAASEAFWQTSHEGALRLAADRAQGRHRLLELVCSTAAASRRSVKKSG